MNAFLMAISIMVMKFHNIDICLQNLLDFCLSSALACRLHSPAAWKAL